MQLIAADLGVSGVEQVLGRMRDAQAEGGSGILVEGGAEGAGYLLAVDDEGVDFRYQGDGPYRLPLGMLIEFGSAAGERAA